MNGYSRQPRLQEQVDVAVAADRPHLVVRDDGGSGDCARLRRILILGQERGAEVDGVDVDLLKEVVPYEPTYETSTDVAQGSAACRPTFHCVDAGSFESKVDARQIAARLRCSIPPPPSDCNCAYCAVTIDDVGGLFTPPDKAVVNGRS